MGDLMFLLTLLGMMAFGVVVPTEAQPKVLTLHEASRFLRISERKLWQMAKASELPCFRVGRQWRFLTQQLLDWASKESK